MDEESCPFCALIDDRAFIVEAELAVAIADKFPLNPGHALVIPRRHEPDFLSLTEEELADVLRLAKLLRHDLASLNLGVNIGESAGQTVPHAHLHVIPRYVGDVGEPRGGVRWILPARARYW